MFAELEAVVCLESRKLMGDGWFMQLMNLRSHRKDFCLCLKSSEWEMSLTGCRQGAMIGSALGSSLWKQGEPGRCSYSYSSKRGSQSP